MASLSAKTNRLSGSNRRDELCSIATSCSRSSVFLLSSVPFLTEYSSWETCLLSKRSSSTSSWCSQFVSSIWTCDCAALMDWASTEALCVLLQGVQSKNLGCVQQFAPRNSYLAGFHPTVDGTAFFFPAQKFARFLLVDKTKSLFSVVSKGEAHCCLEGIWLLCVCRVRRHYRRFAGFPISSMQRDVSGDT